MKRLIIFGLILGVFIASWNWLDVISLRVVGQPSMTGPLQSNLEKPFFESLQKKTDLPIKVDYRTVDTLGFKDNFQLTMMKSGMFDVVSLRFLQNGQEDPTILGVDLPGLNADFKTARKMSEAYKSVIDKNLQKRFEIKLLGLWTFGPQVIFCSRPINQLADLKGLKVRVGGSAYDLLIKSKGGIPVVVPFDQVRGALAAKLVDCAISSEISAYSAKWGDYLTHVYPIATQMGINGIAIRLDVWNRFTKKQKQQLANTVDAYIDESWAYSEQLNIQATNCMQGKLNCELGKKYNLIFSPVIEDDKAYMRKFVMNQSFPAWAASCNKLDQSCSARWREIVEPILSLEDSK